MYIKIVLYKFSYSLKSAKYCFQVFYNDLVGLSFGIYLNQECNEGYRLLGEDN